MVLRVACERCGRSGHHPECQAELARADAEGRAQDVALAAQYAVHGVLGVATPASRIGYEQAASHLERYLGRPLSCSAEAAIEGEDWWFIRETSIGVIGFIVEPISGAIRPVGTGLWPFLGYPSEGPVWSAVKLHMQGGLPVADR